MASAPRSSISCCATSACRSATGLDLCALLRETGYRGKIVLMTGWDTQRVNTDQRSQICDSVLKKPFLGTEADPDDRHDAAAGLVLFFGHLRLHVGRNCSTTR